MFLLSKFLMPAKTSVLFRNKNYWYGIFQKKTLNQTLIFSTNRNHPVSTTGISQNLWGIGKRKESICSENAIDCAMSPLLRSKRRCFGSSQGGGSAPHPKQLSVLRNGNLVPPMAGGEYHAPGHNQ